MALVDYPEKIRPYIFHGVQLTRFDDYKYKGTCPFCDKENHFEVKSDDGKFRCYLCDEFGNVYTFLQLLYDVSLSHYNAMAPWEKPFDLFDLLQDEKGVSIEMAETWGLVPSIITNDILIPAYNNNQSLANLSKVILEDDKWICLSTPGCKKHPFGIHLLCKHERMYLVEGPWDGMNLHRVLVDLGIPADVVALPGIHGFIDDLLPLLPSHVEILFDNDHPRRLASGRVIHPVVQALKHIRKRIETLPSPPNIKIIRWGKTTYHNPRLPNGYDISDLINEEHDSKISYDFLNLYSKSTPMAKKRNSSKAVAPKNRKSSKVNKTGKSNPPTGKANKTGETLPPKNPASTPKQPPVKRTTFQSICDDYASVIHFPQELQDSLAILLSTVCSTGLPGDQLWLRMIGPPGCGKTTLAEAVSVCREYVLPISISTGFHSGYREPGEDIEEDNSLLSRMHGMCTIIKDGDTLLASKDQGRILSEMRDFYDGTARAEYRNKVSREYKDIRTTMVICGTDDLRKLNRSSLGERFLDCEVMSENSDDSAYVDRAMDNAFNRITSGLAAPKGSTEDLPPCDTLFLKDVTGAYLTHLKTNLASTPPPTITENNKNRIKALARFLALARARMGKTREDERIMKPRAEVATRLTGQFTKLAICLAITLNKKEIDLEVIRILRKVAVDSGKSYELDIIHRLADNPEGTHISELEQSLRIGKTSITNRLKSMYEFRIVTTSALNNGSGRRGRNIHVWRLTSRFQQIYDNALGS